MATGNVACGVIAKRNRLIQAGFGAFDMKIALIGGYSPVVAVRRVIPVVLALEGAVRGATFGSD
jgi:hypothetical protein